MSVEEASPEGTTKKRSETIAVSVNLLSTGYNYRDLLNIGLMRPIFSPTEYIQIKGRGTRLFTFRIGNTEYEKKHFFLLDFCAVAEYFEEEYDYSLPLPWPRDKKGKPEVYPPVDGGGDVIHEGPGGEKPEPSAPKEILAPSNLLGAKNAA
jgi:type I restriction enzyme, R subunit